MSRWNWIFKQMYLESLSLAAFSDTRISKKRDKHNRVNVSLFLI